MRRGWDFAARTMGVVPRIEDGKGRGVYELTTSCANVWQWFERKVRSSKRERKVRFFAFMSGDK